MTERKPDIKCTAITGGCIYRNGPTKAPDNTVDNGESHSGSLACFLGGEEWLEYPAQCVFLNSATCIPDGLYDDLNSTKGWRARLYTAVC